MRINVYAEETTIEVETVTKTVTDETFGTRTFYGFRFYLVSPDALHHGTGDDDRSAITVWAKWTRATGNQFDQLAEMFFLLREHVREVAAHEDHADIAAHGV